MTLEEVKQKREENYKIFREIIVKDIHSFFDKVIEEKCTEKFDKIFNNILKDYIYGENNVIIDFSNIESELFPKKNKFTMAEYQRTIVLEDKRINYTLTFNDEEKKWYVSSENMHIEYNAYCKIYNDLILKLLNTLKEFFKDNAHIQYDIIKNQLELSFRWI